MDFGLGRLQIDNIESLGDVFIHEEEEVGSLGDFDDLQVTGSTVDGPRSDY